MTGTSRRVEASAAVTSRLPTGGIGAPEAGAEMPTDTSGELESPPGWRAVIRCADPIALVLPPSAPPGRLAVVCRPLRERLIVGSSQRVEALPAAGAGGPGIVRRRSGGAAVLVASGAQCWVDVFVPAGDALLQADIARSAWWFGEAWVRALGSLLGDGGRLHVHRGPSERTAWSALACFGALGPGEVTLDGRKVVGISQRRNAAGAWLHSMALVRPDAARLAGLLCARAPDAEQLVAELEARSSGVDLDVASLEAALLEELPAIEGR